MPVPLSYILARHGRVGIAGGPNTGKTTLSKRVQDRRVVGTDAYKEIPWEDVPHRMIADVKDDSTYCIEGVQVARALRKGLPLDALVYLEHPMAEQSKGQLAMSKGIRTVLTDYTTKSTLSGLTPPPVYIRSGEGFEEVPATALFRKTP